MKTCLNRKLAAAPLSDTCRRCGGERRGKFFGMYPVSPQATRAFLYLRQGATNQLVACGDNIDHGLRVGQPTGNYLGIWSGAALAVYNGLLSLRSPRTE